MKTACRCICLVRAKYPDGWVDSTVEIDCAVVWASPAWRLKWRWSETTREAEGGRRAAVELWLGGVYVRNIRVVLSTEYAGTSQTCNGYLYCNL